MLNCWRLLANIASFWSNNVATSNDIGSFGFDDVVDDVDELVVAVVDTDDVQVDVDDDADADGTEDVDNDDDVGWVSDGGGVSACSLAMLMVVCEGSVAKSDDGGGGDDEDDAAAGGGCVVLLLVLFDGLVLVRLRGWY